jgi:hypothetical protein
MQEYLFYLYLVFVAAGIAAGLINYSRYDAAAKIILLLLIFTLVSECLSRIIMREPVYQVFNVVETSTIIFYFSRTAKLKYRYFVPGFVVLWIVLCLLNIAFLQPFYVLNTNMISLESFVAITMSLYALYQILIDDAIDTPLQHPHFWIWICLLLYFSCTFFFWPCIRILYRQKSHYYGVVIYSQIIVNILAYAGLSLTLLLYPKMVKHEY